MYYAAMFVKVIVKPRALMAFAIVITELAFGIFILFVAFVSGGLLLPRVWRLQRYGSPTARAPVEEYVSRSPRGACRPPSAWGPRDHPSQTAGQGESTPDVRKPPVTRPALHPEDPSDEEAGRGKTQSVSSADRRRARTSARRRTSERALGSSPRARSTSTSVTIPITVE